jgi:hypothetical protein
MQIYSDFIDARVDHILFENGAERLAKAMARQRMKSDPDYEERLYFAAVDASERIIAAYRR